MRDKGIRLARAWAGLPVPSKPRIELENGGLYILCKNLHAINLCIREKSRLLLFKIQCDFRGTGLGDYYFSVVGSIQTIL